MQVKGKSAKKLSVFLRMLKDVSIITNNKDKLDAYGEELSSALAQAENPIIRNIIDRVKRDLKLDNAGICAFVTKVMLARTLEDMYLVIKEGKGSEPNFDIFKESFKEAIDEFNPDFPKASWNFAEHKKASVAQELSEEDDDEEEDDDTPCDCPVCQITREMG